MRTSTYTVAALIAALPLAIAAPAAAAPAKAHPHPIKLAVGTENADTAGAYVTKLNVKPGATVKIRLSYQNLSHAVQDTTARVAVPSGSKIVGRPAIYNSLHPTGWGVATGLVIHQGKSFGRYSPGAQGFLVITVRLSGHGLHCGSNWTSVRGTVTAAGVGAAVSSARLNQVRVCPTVHGTTAAPN